MTPLCAGARPDRIDYLAQVAASAPGRLVSSQVLAALDLRPGQAVLDVGCGPGTNLAGLAAGVGPHGLVLGIDNDAAMVAAARRRHAGKPAVRVLRGDACALPVAAGSVHRARADRVLQHVPDPARAVAGLRRAVRPGGLITLAEPDWATLAVAADDLACSAGFTAYTCAEAVRNASIGRQLAVLAARAGFTVRLVWPLTPLFDDFAVADQLLGLTRNSRAAVAAGYMSAGQRDRWLSSVREPPVVVTVSLFLVLAEAP